jgi:hypothetical protein
MGIEIIEIYTRATPTTELKEAKKEAIRLALKMESDVIMCHNSTEYILGYNEIIDCPTRKETIYTSKEKRNKPLKIKEEKDGR